MVIQMNTYNLDSVSMQNTQTTDMENIRLKEKIHTDNRLWIGIWKGYSYKFDKNGTLINKKRIYRKRRDWRILAPTHGKNYGMTVLLSRLEDWEYDEELRKGSHEAKALLAYQKDGDTKWTLVDGGEIDQDESLANWFDLQGYTR